MHYMQAQVCSNLQRVDQEEEPSEDCSVLVHSKHPNDPGKAHQRRENKDGLGKLAAFRSTEGVEEMHQRNQWQYNTYRLPFSCVLHSKMTGSK